MSNSGPELTVDLVKWLDEKKKKIVMKAGDDGFEIYVEDKK